MWLLLLQSTKSKKNIEKKIDPIIVFQIILDCSYFRRRSTAIHAGKYVTLRTGSSDNSQWQSASDAIVFALDCVLITFVQQGCLISRCYIVSELTSFCLTFLDFNTYMKAGLDLNGVRCQREAL